LDAVRQNQPPPSKTFAQQAADALSAAWTGTIGGLPQATKQIVGAATDPAQGAAMITGQMGENQRLYNASAQAFRSGDVVTGLSKGADYLLNGIPGVPIGSAIDASQRHLANPETRGTGVGESLALGLNAAAGPASARVLPDVAAWMNEKSGVLPKAPMDAAATSDLLNAIPPSKSAPYDPSDLALARPFLSAEHSEAPITSVEALRDAADSSISQVEQHISTYIGANPTDLIRTKPIDAARRALSDNPRSGAMKAGLKELDDLGLDGDVTVKDADRIRLQLNNENKAILKKNNYDVATARAADPGFAAREAAANALRDGIYDQLQARGIAGVRDLRQAEGSLIKIRNAAQAKLFSGDKTVANTGQNGPLRQFAGNMMKFGMVGTGSALGGPTGAMAASAAGDEAKGLFVKGNLTRDALVQRAFQNSITASPSYPEVPETTPARGLLNAPATTLGPSPDTSYVRSVPAMSAPANPARMLEAGSIGLGPSPDTSSVRAVPARSIVVRLPNGRFARIYTTEPGGSQK
jgi:hypothetical protein